MFMLYRFIFKTLMNRRKKNKGKKKKAKQLQKKKQQNILSHLFFGLIGGFLLGGFFGLLKTPNSGKENQRKLKNYSKDVSNNVQDVSNEVSGLKDSIDNLQFEVEKFKGPFMNEMNLITSDYKLELEPRQRRIKEHQDRLNANIENMNESLQKN